MYLCDRSSDSQGLIHQGGKGILKLKVFLKCLQKSVLEVVGVAEVELVCTHRDTYVRR